MLKKLLTLVLALALLCPALALAEEAAATLTVTGSATVTLEADLAQVVLGVVTKSPTVEEASTANAAALAALIDALKAAGVAEGDMVTEHYSISAQYDYSYGKLDEDQSISGYQVSNLLRVTVHDVAQLGTVVDAGMKAGANECYGITFQSTQASAANDQALQAAVQEGARKAALLAGASGRELGSLLSVKEENDGTYQGVAYAKSVNADGATTILADGLSFTATVTLVYALR